VALASTAAETPRQAFAVLLDRTTGASFESIVDLKDEVVRSWTPLPAGTQPAIMLDEFAACEDGVKKDPRFAEALAKRGIHNLDLVCIEPWSAGYYGADSAGRRLMRALVYTRLSPEDNPYAHPVENLVVVYDLNTGEVVRIEDHGVLPVPRQTGNYTPAHVGAASRSRTCASGAGV
jgi:primary-amine oxidase